MTTRSITGEIKAFEALRCRHCDNIKDAYRGVTSICGECRDDSMRSVYICGACETNDALDNEELCEECKAEVERDLQTINR